MFVASHASEPSASQLLDVIRSSMIGATINQFENLINVLKISNNFCFHYEIKCWLSGLEIT